MQNELDVHLDCGAVYLLSQEIIVENFYSDGETQFPTDLADNEAFLKSQDQRFKIKMRLNSDI